MLDIFFSLLLLSLACNAAQVALLLWVRSRIAGIENLIKNDVKDVGPSDPIAAAQGDDWRRATL